MTEVRDDRERETEVTTASEQAESTAASEPGTEAEIEDQQTEANVEQTGEQAVGACDEKEDAPTEQAASEPASETQYDATFATLEPG